MNSNEIIDGKAAECNPEEIQLLIKVKLLNLKNIAAFGKVK